jgi:hypothetical protein
MNKVKMNFMAKFKLLEGNNISKIVEIAFMTLNSVQFYSFFTIFEFII